MVTALVQMQSVNGWRRRKRRRRELLFKQEFKGADKAGPAPRWYSGKIPLRARPQPQKALTHGG